jgi:hypothetical protein
MLEGESVFSGVNIINIFHCAGASGWGASYGGYPTALWVPTFSQWVEFSGLTEKFPNACGEQDDPDHDGLANLQEMNAGTDPADAQSKLAFEAAARPEDLSAADQTPIAEGRFGLYFQSIPGKSYSVQSSGRLGGEWSTVANTTASNPQSRVVLDRPAGAAFYRLLVNP